MRIVKIGKIKPMEYLAKCKKCECEFAFGLDDIAEKKLNGCMHSKVTFMKCPCCGTDLLIVFDKHRLDFLSEFMSLYAIDKESWKKPEVKQ